jgi:PAS domain-containing protein
MNEIAIIGWTKKYWNFEASHFSSIDQFKSLSLEKQTFPLYIIQCPSNADELTQLLEALPLRQGHHQIILVGIENYPVLTLAHWTRHYPIVSLLNSKEQTRVDDLLNALLLTQRLEEQEQTHQKLLREEESRQEKQYQEMLTELTEQQKQITELQARLLSGLQQEKILHDTLLIIATSQGLGEIETRLQEALIALLGPVHLRVLLHQGATHPQSWAPPAISFELHEHDQALGRFIVHPLEGQSFNRRDMKLLENISEAVALHIPRFIAFEANAALETEWRTTFDAISDPLILVTEDYRIIEANKAARSRMGNVSAFGEPCYRLMFGRASPCEFCRWGRKSNIEESPSKPGEHWEMSSHDLQSKGRKQKIYVHLYRNKFDQLELENKISTVAQAAEVGIFKASLAHELNNPVGGLLTLAQLQKMDLPVDHPLYELVQDIESQALLCRDIILNLLQKTRTEYSNSEIPKQRASVNSVE